jgi:thiamine pyrophosphate-dependent acetolactate synthase large subunit-like protein
MGDGPTTPASGETNLADAVVAALLSCQVDTIFGIGGTHTLQLLGAIERAPAVRFVPARTELGAAYMAIGYARATGRPAVTLTSTGPGALNVVAALEDASWSSTPVLHLTTSIGEETFAGAVHETPNQQPILAVASKTFIRVDPGDVAGSVARAVASTTTRPGGAVTLDVAAGSWDSAVSTLPAPAPVPPVDDEQPDLGPLLADLATAARPVVFAGGGAMVTDRGARVLALAERLGAPVVTSYPARTVAPPDHPLYLGPLATEPRVQGLVGEADLGLVFGSKLSALGTGGWRLPLPEVTYRVESHRGPHAKYPNLRHVIGDAGDVAARLLLEVEPRLGWGSPAGVRAEILAAKRTSHPDEMAFVDAVSRGPGGAALLTADMSKAGFWAMKFLEGPQRAVHGFSGYMAMGSALPMAIGMAVATGEPVVSIVGDGALQMSLAELATLASLRLPVTLIVIVDGAYGILRDNCAAVGGSTSTGVDLWNPDLVALGSAFDMEVTQAATPPELAASLAVDVHGPHLVLVHQRFTREW